MLFSDHYLLIFPELVMGPLKNPESNWTVRGKIVQLLVLPFVRLQPADPSLASLVAALRSRQIVSHLCSSLIADPDQDDDDDDDLSFVLLTLSLLLRLVLIDPALLSQLPAQLTGKLSARLTDWLQLTDRPDLQLVVLSLLNAVLSVGDLPTLADCSLPLDQLMQNSSTEVVKKVLVTIGLLGKGHCPALLTVRDQIIQLGRQDGQAGLADHLQFAALHL